MTDNKIDNKESFQQPSADHPESVSQPKRGLLGSSFIVSMGTMLSRVLGLVRDVVLANLLGAAPNADAFFVAFKIPNFLRRLFAEGAFSQAFVPVLTETRERGSHEAVRHLVDRVAGVLAASRLNPGAKISATHGAMTIASAVSTNSEPPRTPATRSTR